jgi:ribosomal protein S27AE
MGTTGTITGVSRFLKEKNPASAVIGAQPSEGSRIPGIRKWPQEYLPKIYDPRRWTNWCYVSQDDAEDMCRRLAREEGIFAGISAAGACWVAQQIAAQVENATIVFIVCDRGDRYLSTGVFPALPSVDWSFVAIIWIAFSGDMSHDFRFCPRCATPLALLTQAEDGGEKARLRCPACDFTHWNNPTPVLAAVIEYDGQILLARNAAWPGACLR